MLRDELTNEDIPHHSTLQNRIDEIFGQHLIALGKEMRQVSAPPDSATILLNMLSYISRNRLARFQ